MYTQGFVSGSYDDLYAQAERHLERGELEQAEAVLSRIYLRLGKLSEAVVSRRPDLNKLRILSAKMLADLNRRRGNYRRAIELYQQLLETTPAAMHPDWRHVIARLKAENGQVAEGLDEMRSLAVAHSSESWPWLSLGQILLDEKEYEEAVVNLQKAIARSKKKTEDRYWATTTLFVVYKLMGRHTEAEAAWLEAMQSAGNKNRDYYPLYVMYLEAGLLDKAARWLKKEKNPFRLGLHRGLLAQAQGNADAAMKYWADTAARSPPDFETGYEDWAEAALRSNYDPARISRTLLKFIVDENISRYGMLMFAVAEIRRGNFDRAHEIFSQMNISDSDLLPRQERQIFSALLKPSDTESFKKYFQTEPE